MDKFTSLFTFKVCGFATGASLTEDTVIVNFPESIKVPSETV